MVNNKKILIVGGTGFIGYHLAKKLANKNSVTSISTKNPTKLRFLKKVKYLKFDISYIKNFSIINNLEFDYVINLSGYVDHSKKIKIFKSHYQGCKNLVNFLKKKKIKFFIQIGSCTEYGHLKSPHQEKSKLKVSNLKSFYSKAKLKASNFILNELKKNNIHATILRPYLIYGPYQDYNRLVSIVFKNCILGKSFPCSNGNQVRNFLYIDDFIQAIILTLNLKPKCKIINIGSTKSYKVKYIIKKINSMTQKGKPLFGSIKLRPDEPKKIFPDLSNSRKILCWKEKFSLSHGLKKTYLYYKKNVK